MSNKTFGEFIKDIRIKKGLSIYKLSKESGVSHTYISQIEHGIKEQPSPEIIKKLANALDSSYAALMFEAGHIDDGEFWDYASDEVKKSKENVVKSPSGYFDELIREYIHLLLSDREHPFHGSIEDAFSNRIGELYKKYGVESKRRVNVVENGKVRDDIPDQYADMINSTENVQFKWDVFQELQEIAHDFHLRFNPSFEVGSRQPRPKKLEEIIEHDNLTYKGEELTEDDRRRLLDMLKLMFPDRS